MNPYFIIGLLVIWALSLAGAFSGGIKIEGDHRDAQQLVIERGQEQVYQAGVTQQRRIAGEISARLADQRTGSTQQLRTFNERIHNAPPLLQAPRDACPAAPPGSGAGDAPIAAEPPGDDGGGAAVAGAFVGLWNDALETGLQPDQRPPRADVPGGRADPPESAILQGDSTLRSALDNLAENAASCNELRTRVSAWESWARQSGLAP